MNLVRLLVCLVAVGIASTAVSQASGPDKPRVVVTADPELDASNSPVRYLLYSTDFKTEGLIYASSQYHWKGDGTGKKWFVPGREYTRFGLNLGPMESWRWAPNERFIDDAVELYETVYPNLKVHDPGYPTPAELKSKIRWGNVEFDGDISKDTPGSDLIKRLLLDDNRRPLYLLAWGGQSTIARALKSIQDQYQGMDQWTAIYKKVSQKAILSTSGDQDDTYAKYIKPNWPELRTLRIGRGGVPLAYGANLAAGPDNAVYYSAEWTRDNILSKGPLGASYRVWGDGKQMVKGEIFDYFGLAGFTAEELRAKGEFLGEGDTFTYLNLLDNGLRGYDDATPGGWSGYGAFVPGAPPVPSGPNFAGANHAPTVRVRGSARLSARPGATVRLRATVSDPDKNSVSVKWWQFREVGTYPGDVAIADPTALDTTVRVPADAKPGQTIHLVLEATDNGTPPLSRYEHVILTVAK